MKNWNAVRLPSIKSEGFIFVVLIIIHLIPIWLFEYFPSQDGPVHLENATILSEYHNPEASTLRQYYIINKSNISNWLIQIVLAGLISITSLSFAEKIMLSGYIILMPLSVRYALKAINPGAKFLTFLSFPFIYNYTFHVGFYSFAYSLPMFFFVMGFWLKFRNQITFSKTLMFSALLLTTYLLHIVSFVMAYIGVLLLTVFIFFWDFKSKRIDIKPLADIYKRQIKFLLMAFLPTFILIIAFLSQQGVGVLYYYFYVSAETSMRT
ncbi:MAG: hypothetical protein ACYSWS_02730 [Planctomycetota bacterium]|jgi:hypothetical protein